MCVTMNKHLIIQFGNEQYEARKGKNGEEKGGHSFRSIHVMESTFIRETTQSDKLQQKVINYVI